MQEAHWMHTTNVRPYNHPAVRLFATQRIDFIKRLLGTWRPTNALDVGCGDGFGMSHMKEIVPDIHGCDISEAMLKANPSDQAKLKKASAYELPYEDASFDLVYCWELLHHVDRPIDAVLEMKRVSRKCVMLCEPNSLNPAMFMFGVLAPIERGLLKFTPGYTKKLLEEAGLKNIQQFTVSLYTPNQTPYFLAKLLSKLPYRIPFFGLYSINVGYKD